MPKAKSDQVITHRIELQNTERELIETAILVNGASRSIVGIAQGIGAAVSGMGQMLAPAMGALAAWYITDKTIDEIKELGERQKTGIEENLAESYEGTYGAIVAWMSATYQQRGYAGFCFTVQEAGVLDFEWEERNKNAFLPEIVDDLNYGNPVHDMIFGSEIAMAGESKIPNWFAARIANYLRMYCRNQFQLDPVTDPGPLFAQFYTLEEFGRDQYYYAQRTYTQAGGALGTLWSAATGWAN